MVRRSPSIALLTIALQLAGALGASAASDANVMTVEQRALGVTVIVHARLHPSGHPGLQADTGAYLESGSVSIVAGPHKLESTFSFGSLGVLPPNPPQIVPTGASSGCGVGGPIAVAKLAASPFPVVVVTTIENVEGCVPLVHVFVPPDGTAATYAPVASYNVAHPPRGFIGLRMIPLRPDATLRVIRVRIFALPEAPPSYEFAIRGWPIAVIDGTDGSDKLLTIAVNRPLPEEVPAIGETLSVFGARPGGTLPVIRLSSEHERRYQVLHPLGPALPTPPPPPVPATPIQTPLQTASPLQSASPMSSPVR